MTFNRRKGQQEVVSIILISGILIGVVGSVYFWGVPLIQKNKDIATLENSEAFMRNLNNKIKFVATNGGRDQLPITIPGIVRFIPDDAGIPAIKLIVDTEGTIYSTGAEIPLGKNTECGLDDGTFAVDDPETLCVESGVVSQKDFRTSYTLKYLNLSRTDILQNFQIKLTGTETSGGERNVVVFENKGQQRQNTGGRTLISTLVEISII